MRYSEISTPILFRGFRELNFFADAIVHDRIVGSTTQRYWPDGKRRKDNDPEYQSSNWMKGVSFTRDIKFAMKWGSAVIAVDKSIIAQRHKIVPFNWGYSIPSGNHHKREREEFVITHLGGDYPNMLGFKEPEGEIRNLSSMLKGIWLTQLSIHDPKEKYPLDTYYQKQLLSGGLSIMDVVSHPKFKGFYDDATAKVFSRQDMQHHLDNLDDKSINTP